MSDQGTNTGTTAATVKLTGSPHSPARRIGTVTLTQAQTFTRTYETAAWYQEIIVSAGTQAELTCNGYYVFVSLKGTKGRSCFTPRIGAYYGPSRLDEGIGEPATYALSIYAYAAAEAIAAGTFLAGADVELDDGVEVISEERESFCDPGTTRTHWAFTVAA